MAKVLVKIAVMMMAPQQRSGATGSKGERAPFFFFFLDLLPRWEKGSPLVLGLHDVGGARAPPRLDLSLCLSVFLRCQILPFHCFFYIRRSVNPIGLKPLLQFFFQKLAFFRPKKSSNHLTGGPRGGQARPLPLGPLGHHLTLIFFPKITYIPKKSLSVFIPFGLRLIRIYCETKNMQQTGTCTGHWINMLVPKNSIKSCQKYI